MRQMVPNHVGQQRRDRQEEVDTSRIPEFMSMNPLSFMCSITTKDPEYFVEELNKVFDVMHVADTERVDLAAYELKMWLELGLIDRRWVEIKMCHI